MANIPPEAESDQLVLKAIRSIVEEGRAAATVSLVVKSTKLWKGGVQASVTRLLEAGMIVRPSNGRYTPAPVAKEGRNMPKPTPEPGKKPEKAATPDGPSTVTAKSKLSVAQQILLMAEELAHLEQESEALRRREALLKSEMAALLGA